MAHINEVQMTYEEPCHTTDTLYLSATFLLRCAIVTFGSSPDIQSAVCTVTKHDCMPSINALSVQFSSLRSSASPFSFSKTQNPNRT